VAVAVAVAVATQTEPGALESENRALREELRRLTEI
jgi:hypothetical protein